MIAQFSYYTAVSRGLVQRALALRRTGLLLMVTLFVSTLSAIGVSLNAAPAVQAGGICIPDSSYSTLTPLSLTQAPAGLTVSDNGTATYGVGGTSVSMIRGALASCAPSFTGANPSGEFLAYTSYAVNWSYDAARVDGVTCRLSNVKVGLHLRQLLPDLVTRQSVSPSVSDKWSRFIAGLAEHEDGHKALDITQSRSLLADLENLRAPCGEISARANSLAVTHLGDFVTVNADHDTKTSYGRDQGAQW